MLKRNGFHATQSKLSESILLLVALLNLAMGLTGCSGLVNGNSGTNTASSPTITAQPTNQTVTAGKTATFSVVATGTSPLSYQWRKGGTAVSGATSASYTTPTTTSSDNGAQFTVMVSNTAGSATSNAATLTVNSGTAPPSVPTGLTAGAATSSEIDLSWNASTGSVAGYKIFRGGSQMGTSTTTSFADTGLAASTTYSYAVAAFDAAGNTSAQSASASATTLASSGGGGIPNTLGWYSIPNTALSSVQQTSWPAAGDPSMVVEAWGGGAYDSKRNRLIVWGGGHGDYKGNEVYVLDLSANPIAPLRLNEPGQYSPDGTCHNTQPGHGSDASSRHTYETLAYLPTQDVMFNIGGAQVDSGCLGDNVNWFNFSAKTWAQKIGSVSAWNNGIAVCDYDPNRDQVLCFNNNNGDLWIYNPVSNSMTLQSPSSGGFPTLDVSGVVDYAGKRFYVVGGGYVGYYDISGAAPFPVRVDLTSASGCTTFASGHYPGVQYDPVQKLLVEWHGGDSVNTFNPATNSCSSQTYAGGPGAQRANGTNGRFRYVSSMGVFIVCNAWSQNCYSLRMTPGGTGGSSGPTISAVGASSITTSGATVGWTTDVGATTQVEYGTTTAYGTLTTLNSSLVTSHSVPLSGLSTNTLYHYRVHSKNSAGTESISGDFAFQTNNTSDTTPPSVSITSPAAGATLSGAVTLAASATDNVGVTSVQFQLDGVTLGSALTSSPYSMSWDTTTASNAVHILTAQARDAAGNVGTSIGVSVTISNSTNTALLNFQTRCALPGVLNCQGFDDAATFTSVVSESGLTDGFGTASHPNLTRDTSVFLSGGSSANFFIPAGAGENDTGNWWQFFGQGSNNRFFGQNSTFYVQYGFRADAAWTGTDWTQYGASGSNTAPKISIFHNVIAGSCAMEEITIHNHNAKNLPTLYTECGSRQAITGSDGVTYSEAGPLLYFHQGWTEPTPFTGYECEYNNGAFSGPNCFHFVANQWYTLYFKITIGTWGSPNSSVEGWVAPYGQQMKKFLNTHNYVLQTESLCNATNSGPGSSPCLGFNVLELTQFMTGKISGNTSPAAHVWYDEVIISSQPIAAPAGTNP